MSFTHDFKTKLLAAIHFIELHKELFVNNPKTDFSRKRSLSITDIFLFLFSMQEKSLADELLDFYNFSPQGVSSSAMIQARSKLKLSAFESVFHASHVTSYDARQYHGYRILAQDGSDINIMKADPDDPSASLLHLNAFYDLLSSSYIAAQFQLKKQVDERQSLCDIIDQTSFTLPAIILADRGYESYNVFEHINQAGQKFLIRAKDRNSNGILSGLDLPTESEFDLTIKLKLTRRQTKFIKAAPTYRFLSQNTNFDYLPVASKDTYPISFRIVRIKVAENTYEALITNLEANEFTSNALKELYHMRWGIETSFRELKYSLGLEYLHSQKLALIKQEIYARLTMYNFVGQIVAQAKVPPKSEIKHKYEYQVNFTRACSICREFLRNDTITVMELINKCLLPIRPKRSAPRNLCPHHFKGFLYRIA